MKEWDWYKDGKNDSISIAYDETDNSDLEHKQAKTRRPSRTRSMPTRLQECEMTPDDEVTDEGDLVHLAFLADV
ncbi:hypothetical protein A2U01_0080393, partial [Trifolium medium]|nr:hypothetical protein [Trifolium medium]